MATTGVAGGLEIPLQVEYTQLNDIQILRPSRIGDVRGFFSETWNKRVMAEAGLIYEFVQDNHSMSAQAGTLRGLHFQSPPHAQAKLVRCGRGRLLDVVVDIRVGSPTYGQWLGVELSFENGRQLMIPPGFLHGFVTRELETEIVYKCSDYYAPDYEGTVRWDDPAIGIDWNLSGSPILSEKDANAPTLAEIGSVFTYKGKT